MIFCEYDLCIYNKKNRCILKNISIAPAGFCDDCIIPEIDDKILQKSKKETLAKFESRYKNMLNNKQWE